MKGSLMVRAALGASLASAAPLSERRPDGEPDIVGGTAVGDISDFPFIAEMRESGRFICGGTVMSETKILTAAHCAVDGDASGFSFRVGSLQQNSGGQIVKAASKAVHPQYDPNTVDYDVAVITLADPIQLGNGVEAAKLTGSGDATQAGQDLTVIGWGATSDGGDVSDDLLQVTVPVVDHAECASDYSGAGTITDRMFCAAESGKDSCNGDSGGPIVDAASKTLVGGVSWGQGCAQAKFPGVYADYADSELNAWITSQL